MGGPDAIYNDLLLQPPIPRVQSANHRSISLHISSVDIAAVCVSINRKTSPASTPKLRGPTLWPHLPFLQALHDHGLLRGRIWSFTELLQKRVWMQECEGWERQ